MHISGSFFVFTVQHHVLVGPLVLRPNSTASTVLRSIAAPNMLSQLSAVQLFRTKDRAVSRGCVHASGQLREDTGPMSTVPWPERVHLVTINPTARASPAGCERQQIWYSRKQFIQRISVRSGEGVQFSNCST
jgi:hypothetical protein